MKKLLPILFVLLCALSCHSQDYVTIQASNVHDSGNHVLASGTAIFSPVDNAGNPISYQAGGGGQVLSGPITFPITNGAFTGTIANSANTNPINVCFQATIRDQDNKIVLGGTNQKSGYQCVQTAVTNFWCLNATCNFDQYFPQQNGIPIVPLPPPSASSLGGVYANNCTATGQFSKGYDTTGNPICATPAGGGTITGVNPTAGGGLQGGGVSGDVSLGLITSCSNGQGLIWNGSVWACGATSPVWGGITGNLTNQTDLINELLLLAPLASPTFTGSPAAPTQSSGDSSTKLATTAFVKNQGYGTVTAVNPGVGLSGGGSSGAVTLNLNNPIPVNTLGNAATATALQAIPTQCNSNNFSVGIAANGNANCLQPSASSLSNGTTGSGLVVLGTSPTIVSPIFSGTATGNISGNSGTATALAATPTQCTSGNVSTGIAANGNSNCTPAGTGNVTGPVVSTPNDIAIFNNSLGTGLADSGISYPNVVTQASPGTANQLATYGGTGKVLTPATTLPTAAEPAHTGDATNLAGSLAMTVKAINGQLLSSLGTGILKNTTVTGVPSIAVAGDFPILNQSTTGNAATSSAFDHVPTQCSGAQFAQGITATGDANCQTPPGGGNVSNSGTPTAGQLAVWINATAIGGLSTTGSGNAVLATSPTLVTPTLGAASATSINKYTFTAPATGATLTILDGKTVTFNNSITFAGGEGTTQIFPGSSGTLLSSATAPGGDLTGTYPNPTVKGINGVALGGLATGILKNTTTTGVPSIAVAGDFPTLNQSTTGNAATATAFDHAPTQCSGGQFSTGIQASGAANCSTVPSGASVAINGGTPLGSPVNFQNGTGGNIVNFSNPTGNNVQATLQNAGVTNAMLANSSITENLPSSVFGGSGSVSLGSAQTFTLNSQSANLIWASPDNASGPPGFRAFVPRDLPNPFTFPGKYTGVAGTTSAATFNVPSGVAPTTPVTGDVWNQSGILKFFDGTATNSLVTIQGAKTSGNVPAYSGVNGLLGAGYSVAGTDVNLASASTISSTPATPVCSTGNGGITTSGCPSTTVASLPTSPNGIPQNLISTPSGGVGQPTQWGIPGVAIDTQTGTSYNIPIGDDAHFLTGNNSSPTSWFGFPLANNYVFSFMNLGAGLITYTPNSGTVNGGATQIIPQNWFGFHYTDNTSTVMPLMPTYAAFPNTSGTQALGFNNGVFSATNFPAGVSSGTQGWPYVNNSTITGTSNTTSSLYIDANQFPGSDVCAKIAAAGTSASNPTFGEGVVRWPVSGQQNCAASPFTGWHNGGIVDFRSAGQVDIRTSVPWVLNGGTRLIGAGASGIKTSSTDTSDNKQNSNYINTVIRACNSKIFNCSPDFANSVPTHTGATYTVSGTTATVTVNNTLNVGQDVVIAGGPLGVSGQNLYSSFVLTVIGSGPQTGFTVRVPAGTANCASACGTVYEGTALLTIGGGNFKTFRSSAEYLTLDCAYVLGCIPFVNSAGEEGTTIHHVFTANSGLEVLGRISLTNAYGGVSGGGNHSGPYGVGMQGQISSETCEKVAGCGATAVGFPMSNSLTAAADLNLAGVDPFGCDTRGLVIDGPSFPDARLWDVGELTITVAAARPTGGVPTEMNNTTCGASHTPVGVLAFGVPVKLHDGHLEYWLKPFMIAGDLGTNPDFDGADTNLVTVDGWEVCCGGGTGFAITVGGSHNVTNTTFQNFRTGSGKLIDDKVTGHQCIVDNDTSFYIIGNNVNQLWTDCTDVPTIFSNAGIQFNGTTSGSFGPITATATGGTLNLGANSTLTSAGALTVTGCTGCVSTAKNTRTAAITDLAPVSADSGLILALEPATAIHLTRLFCAVQGSTNVVLNLDKRAEGTIGTDSGAHLLGADLTAVSGGANTATWSNTPCGGTSSCAIAAHAPVVVTFTSVSGTPTALNCSLDYTVD